MQLRSDFQFSQNNLQDYVDCARRFFLHYLVQMRFPAPISEPVLEQERRIQRGEQFHRLVQQHLLGIPVETLQRMACDPELLAWFNAYLDYKSTLDLPMRQNAEYTLFTRSNGIPILAKYDLLAIEPGRAMIFDWKTSGKPPSRVYLAKRMQTHVYPYLLVQAGNRLNGGEPIEPESIQMTYWFPGAPAALQTFSYSTGQFEQDKAFLEDTIADILEREDENSFPKTLENRRCLYCNYRSFCDRGVKAGDIDSMEEDEDIIEESINSDFDSIQEIDY